MALKAVYQAENEFMANTIRDLLEQNGVPALIHSFQIPAYDGLAQMMRPAWGEVQVEETDLPRAREIIDGFLGGESDRSVREGDV
ncbi:MAG: putative signal transducing protein [bacterium]